MSALPAATAVISPLASTVATASSLLLQLMTEAAPEFSFAVALSCSPGHRSARVGWMLMDEGARYTFTLTVAVWPNSLVTVMVALLP